MKQRRNRGEREFVWEARYSRLQASVLGGAAALCGSITLVLALAPRDGWRVGVFTLIFALASGARSYVLWRRVGQPYFRIVGTARGLVWGPIEDPDYVSVDFDSVAHVQFVSDDAASYLRFILKDGMVDQLDDSCQSLLPVLRHTREYYRGRVTYEGREVETVDDLPD